MLSLLFPCDRGAGLEVVLSGRAWKEVRMMGQNLVLVEGILRGHLQEDRRTSSRKPRKLVMHI
jgi:hypothetical protein